MKTQTFGWSDSVRSWFTFEVGLNIYARTCARANYEVSRRNGDDSDNPSREFPGDGSYSNWIWHHKDDDGTQWYRIKYTEGPGDRAWMEEKDRNYLARLKPEKKEKKAAKKKKTEALAIKEKELAIEQQRLELEKLKIEKEMLAMKLEMARLQSQQEQRQAKPPEQPEVSRTLPDTNMSRMSSDTAMSGSRDEDSATTAFFKG